MPPLQGLIAATLTPFHPDGSLNLPAVADLVEHLLNDGVSGLYVCGSTGEGVSLSTNERMALAEAFVNAAASRVPVVVQVGHNSLVEAKDLAAHAEEIGAAAVSATPPCYFPIDDAQMLLECIQPVAAAAPKLPFYYYHIPCMTGVTVNMPSFLSRAANHIPNLAGLKFSDSKLPEFQQCLELDGGRFDCLWGTDQMLLAALTVGCRGAVGSTYNFAAPLYLRMIDAYDTGDITAARRLQSQSVEIIHTMQQHPFFSATKHVLRFVGVDTGPCRLPHRELSAKDAATLESDLKAIHFLDAVPVDTQPAVHSSP